MNIWKIGIDSDCSSFAELKKNHTVSQGWPDFGDLSFAYIARDESYRKDFDVFMKECCYGDGKAPHTFRRLLEEINSHDIVLAFEGNTLLGITEMPDNFIYYYNDSVEDYTNCLFPVQTPKGSLLQEGSPFRHHVLRPHPHTVPLFQGLSDVL